MAIQFTCTNPSCGRSIHAPDTAAGKKARCPKCGQVVTIPSAEGVFPTVENETPAVSKPSRPAAARQMMIGVPPTLQKKMNMRPFIAGGIVLFALAIVAIVVVMALKGNDKKTATPAQSAQVTQTDAKDNTAPHAPNAPTVAVAPGPKAPANPPAAAPANPPAAVPANPSSPPPSNPAGSSQNPGQVAVTPGAGLTVVNTPAEYTGAVLGSRTLGQRAKSLENMKLVRDAITAYTIETDRFPTSWSEMTGGGRLNPEATKSAGDPKKNFVLVSGQTPNSPKTNILAYDPYPYGRTSMVIIEIEGSPKFIDIEDLKKQLQAQGAKANEIPD